MKPGTRVKVYPYGRCISRDLWRGTIVSWSLVPTERVNGWFLKDFYSPEQHRAVRRGDGSVTTVHVSKLVPFTDLELIEEASR